MLLHRKPPGFVFFHPNDSVVVFSIFIDTLKLPLLPALFISDIFIMLLWCQVGIKELIGFVCHHLATVFAYFYVSVSA